MVGGAAMRMKIGDGLEVRRCARTFSTDQSQWC